MKLFSNCKKVVNLNEIPMFFQEISKFRVLFKGTGLTGRSFKEWIEQHWEFNLL